MNWFSGVVTYVLIWWLVLFMVLPWGIRPIGHDDVLRGHDAGAPQRPRIGLKVAVTSLVAVLLWLVAYFIVDSGAISFRP